MTLAQGHNDMTDSIFLVVGWSALTPTLQKRGKRMSVFTFLEAMRGSKAMCPLAVDVWHEVSVWVKINVAQPTTPASLRWDQYHSAYLQQQQKLLTTWLVPGRVTAAPSSARPCSPAGFGCPSRPSLCRTKGDSVTGSKFGNHLPPGLTLLVDLLTSCIPWQTLKTAMPQFAQL